MFHKFSFVGVMGARRKQEQVYMFDVSDGCSQERGECVILTRFLVWWVLGRMVAEMFSVCPHPLVLWSCAFVAQMRPESDGNCTGLSQPKGGRGSFMR